jgi:hypothetical protein
MQPSQQQLPQTMQINLGQPASSEVAASTIEVSSKAVPLPSTEMESIDPTAFSTDLGPVTLTGQSPEAIQLPQRYDPIETTALPQVSQQVSPTVTTAGVVGPGVATQAPTAGLTPIDFDRLIEKKQGDIKPYTNADLKKFLTERCLKKTGKKSELLARLRAALT